MTNVNASAATTHPRKTVAVIGGSFDPPTFAHLMVASQVVQLGCADEAWMIPCGNRPDKDTRVDAATRLRMTQVAIEAVMPDEFPVKCCDIEVANGSFIPTVSLMRRLRERYPNITFRFVIGSDLPSTLLDWDHGSELIAENEFIVLPRPDSKPESEWPEGFKYMKVTDRVTANPPLLTTDISSTAARNRLRELGWLGAVSIIPKQVLEIIRDKGLFFLPETSVCLSLKSNVDNSQTRIDAHQLTRDQF
ncbi:nucleotidyltransferase, putative [Perkinsus marinus ATCC 50983]|uniref:Nucleotidyltransferase, putative n=1 Tax=Perkinsus marinus (strain ATCC 50983 / TXsc) TaxID=423536 RepID=C5KAV3_PERM5|nr:nucleotidyltransferase, putative [Perkinsus marinus ATCC 50983]EER18279.1 nucleotidyltransferase, putative [Perkinsus marinus ATCC 50983]|eukprot:XP_002786483.1 nucleotidyltransferase, putative [Perkinsus marinus ATCC 50983]